MKKAVSVFVLFLLVLSIFSIAEETVVSAAETPAQITSADSASSSEACGFWCKISEFLFGNKENRAGLGWFDREGALVGK